MSGLTFSTSPALTSNLNRSCRSSSETPSRELSSPTMGGSSPPPSISANSRARTRASASVSRASCVLSRSSGPVATISPALSTPSRACSTSSGAYAAASLLLTASLDTPGARGRAAWNSPTTSSSAWRAASATPAENQRPPARTIGSSAEPSRARSFSGESPVVRGRSSTSAPRPAERPTAASSRASSPSERMLSHPSVRSSQRTGGSSSATIPPPIVVIGE